MDWLVIEGVRPWDGRYEFDLVDQPTTQREWGWIKRLSGYMPLTMEQGLQGGDPELFAAFAVIALHRAGRIQPAQAQDIFDRFLDVPFGSAIRLEMGEQADTEDEEDDAGPPAGSSTSSANGSGDSSKTSSERLADPMYGIPASATSESRKQGSRT